MSSARTKVRGRPAHPAGPTFLAYTRDGSRLVTAGANNVVRVYETGSDGEPMNIDECEDNNLAVAATNDFLLVGSEDGTVAKYTLPNGLYEKYLVRFSLPVRDIAVTPDGRLAACCSDEVAIKVIDTGDSQRIFQLDDHTKPVKHLTFDNSGTYLCASCTDGVVYIYSFSTEQPKLIRRIEGAIRQLETDAEASSQAAWHPDGQVLALPNTAREVAVHSDSGAKIEEFKNGHDGDIRAVAWSPNGALLASADADKIVLWDSQTRSIISTYDYPGVLRIVWHPKENIVSFTSNEGEVFMHKDFVPESHASRLSAALKSSQPQPLTEVSGNQQRAPINGDKPIRRRPVDDIDDDLDEILGDFDDGLDNFVEDDDGAGYTLNGNGKRPRTIEDDGDGHLSKRQEVWEPDVHRSFQPGSTPWRGDRRYLCLNLTGFVWTVEQPEKNTVTVDFYDKEHRDFHFSDPYRYDKACLNDAGALFACPSGNGHRALVYYRPHETWTARADWRTELPAGEEITAIALTESFITVTTTANYVRVYTLFGTPFRIYRQKSTPTVTCAAWRDYVLTMGNGPVGADGSTKLVYTIENVRRDETLQSDDTVALPEDAELKSVFFSDKGDPCIYDTQGVLLVLQHWRTPGQARWVPLLDTKLLERLATGRKEETYWPVAVAFDKFHCIILKGGDQYPYFPRPMLTEFDFHIPVSEQKTDEDGPRLEEAFVRTSLMHSLMEDLVSSTHSTHSQRTELARLELDIDKTLLQLINVECRNGEEHGMKALEIVQLLRDRSGKMLEAAGKIAGRHGQGVLEDKIRDVAEKRLAGDDDEE